MPAEPAMSEAELLVVVGVSRPCLPALTTIVRSLPVNFPAAIAVAFDTALSKLKLMPALIASQTRLKVSYAQEGGPIQQGCVYLAPPRRQIVVKEVGYFSLDPGPPVNPAIAVDQLFLSAARVYKAGAIGVLLTESDVQGFSGLRAIKRMGGRTVERELARERIPEIKTNRISDKHRNFRIPTSEIAKLLCGLVHSYSSDPD